MKVLDFAPTQVYPPKSGGWVRMYELGRMLSLSGVDYTILSMVSTMKKAENIEVNPNYKISEFKPYFTSLLYLKSVLGFCPFPVQLFYAKKMFKKFIKEKESADVYQFEFPWLTSLYEYLSEDKPVVYSAHNVEYDWFREEVKKTLFPKKNESLLFSAEKHAVTKSDRVITVSEFDRNRLTELYGVEKEKIKVIPNGYTREDFAEIVDSESIRRKLGIKDNQKIVVFMGSNHHPNRKAAEIILDEIAPNTEDKYVFLILGSVGKALKRNKTEKIICTGEVEDVIPYLKASDIAVNPMSSGSGSNLKVLQYLAAGLPLISTDFGMRGFEDLKGYVYLSKAEDFADLVEKDLKFNNTLNEKLSRYEWRNLAGEMKKIYLGLLG